MGRYGAWRTALLTGMIVVLTTLGLPRVTAAQRPGQVPRIAFLGINFPPSTSAPSPFRDEFRQGLRERGWVEGHTIAIEWRWAEGSFDRFASLVAEVIRLPVEVIVVPTATTAAIAKRATTTIPIVVIAGGALLETGLIASLARPGGNITGIHFRTMELTPKQLELLKQAVPSVTLAPGNKISGGKVLNTTTRRSANRAAAIFRLSAMNVGQTQTALGAFYRRLASRAGKAKAVTATARKLAVLFYNTLRYGMAYEDPGAAYYEDRYRQRVLKGLHRRAKEFGYTLTEVGALEGVSYTGSG